MKRKVLPSLITLILACAFVWPRVAASKPSPKSSPDDPLQARISNVFQKIKASVVVVKYSFEYFDDQSGRTRKGSANACGLIVDPSGLVMMPGFVAVGEVKPFSMTVKLDSGEERETTYLGKDTRVNVTFARIAGSKPDEKFPALSFSVSPELRVGEQVLLVGILPETLNFEKALRLCRINGRSDDPRTVFTTDVEVPFPFGFYGAAVVRTNGDVVGVMGHELRREEGEQIYTRWGYPLVFTSDLFVQLIKNPPQDQWGSGEEASLGILTQPLTEELAEYWGLPAPGGIVVSTVVPNTAAEQAGLQRGDIIVRFNGKPITATEDIQVFDFTRLVNESGIGKPVDIEVIRQGQRLTLTATLQARPKTQLQVEQVEDPDLGLTAREIAMNDVLGKNLDPNTRGVMVHRVQRAGWASLAGLRPDDIIQEIGGKRIETVKDFQSVVEEAKNARVEELIFFVLRQTQTAFLRVETDWGKKK